MTKVNNNHSNPKPHRNKIEKTDLKHFSIQQLYEKAVKAYQQNDTQSQDRWNKMLAQSGTKKDKISAIGALILENPQSSLKYFEMLTKWCFDKNHNFAITACQAMGNIYSDHIFGDKSSLNLFVDSVQKYIRENKKNTQVTNAELVGFYLESQIKQYYSEFIKALEILLNDQLNHIKKSCIKILGNLARFKQLRRTILALIINKLGDSDMDIVNQVSKCLKDGFYQDILASETLMEETETFLFRSNLPHKAQFYVINFLNNINLKFLNEKSLNKMFEIFYHFFTKCVSAQENSDELASRLFLNSIKGLNRIFSFMKGGSKETKKIVQEKIQDVYKIVHTTPNIKAKIQLLLFLFQSHAYLHGNLSSNNRFYRVLYDFINNDQIIHSSLSEIFFDLILVCMKEDQNLNRVLAMCKRMLHLCFGANSNFIITTLLMIDKVIQFNEGLKIFLHQAENVMEDEPENREYYDSNKRDPCFAGAEKTCLWELKTMSNHFHPTVRKFANAIIAGEPIQYEGNNPLLQFNLTSFIEKMSLKKQKKSDAWKIKVKRNLPKIRSSKYQTLLNKQLSDFKEDEEFIKKYLEKRSTIHKNKRKIQTKDIEQYADQVIQKEMDRLNPKQMDEELSITPVGSEQEDLGSWDEENQNFEEGQGLNDYQQENQQGEQLEEEEFGSQGIDQDAQMGEQDQQFDQQDEEGVEQKQFEDVFDQIQQDEDSFPNKGKGKNKGKGFSSKHKGIHKNPHNSHKKDKFKSKQKPNKFNKGNKNFKKGKRR